MNPASDRRALFLLSLGAAVGIGMAAWGLARSGSLAPLPGGAVAVVNGQALSREAYDVFVSAVAEERRMATLSAEERHRLLQRMIDEELLLQHGIQLGLARHEPTARRSIVSALITTIAVDAETEDPDEATLRAYHQEEQERFTLTGRVEVEHAWIGIGSEPEDARLQRAQEIARRARDGEGLDAVASQLGDEPAAPLPAGLLPVETLRQYLGPTAALAAVRLPVGGVSDPIRSMGGYHVLRVARRSEGELAPFEEVRDQVRAAWLRAQGEQALERTLEELRAASDIRIDPSEVPSS